MTEYQKMETIIHDGVEFRRFYYYKEKYKEDTKIRTDYFVSKEGRVISTIRKDLAYLKLKPYKPELNEYYIRPSLVIPGVGDKCVPVHHMVILTYVGPPEKDDMVVDHINANRTDNRLENLRWGTLSQNTRWSMELGRYKTIKDRHKETYIKKVYNIFETYKGEEMYTKLHHISGICIEELKYTDSPCTYIINNYNKESNLFYNGELYYKCVYQPTGVIKYYISMTGKMIRLEDDIVPVSSARRDGLEFYINMTIGDEFGIMMNVKDLMARTFLGEPPTSLHEVRYKDGNKFNLNIDNLEWYSKSDKLDLGIIPNNGSLISTRVDPKFDKICVNLLEYNRIYYKGIRTDYLISTTGVVLRQSCISGVLSNIKYRKMSVYVIAYLSIEDHRIDIPVHKLMELVYFAGTKPKPKWVLTHQDGDVTNNDISNLVWVPSCKNEKKSSTPRRKGDEKIIEIFNLIKDNHTIKQAAEISGTKQSYVKELLRRRTHIELYDEILGEDFAEVKEIVTYKGREYHMYKHDDEPTIYYIDREGTDIIFRTPSGIFDIKTCSIPNNRKVTELNINGKRIGFQLGKIVLLVFGPDQPDINAKVAYKDKNTLNNHIDNLYWK